MKKPLQKKGQFCNHTLWHQDGPYIRCKGCRAVRLMDSPNLPRSRSHRVIADFYSSLCVLILCAFTSSVFAQEDPHKFGWIGDDGSKPVRMMGLHQWPITTPAASSDLTPKTPPPYDQGPLGSCVGNGTTLAWDMVYFCATGRHLPLSRLMVYYNARAAEGMTGSDSGCQIVDAMNSLMQLGSAKETLWPYTISKFRTKPGKPAYTEALKHRVIRAYKIDNTDGQSVRLALTNGRPVVFGSMVYAGIQTVTKSAPIIPLPRKGERPIGGHCMTIIGHDDARQLYRVQNSWGSSWGDGGRCWIPYAYIHNGHLTEDVWVPDEVML